MGIGKRIIRAFKGEEELRVVFWKGVVPLALATILLSRYVLFPYLGLGVSLGVIGFFLLCAVICLCRCWTNCSAAFHEEICTILKFLGVLWIAAVMMSPVFYMLYFRD